MTQPDYHRDGVTLYRGDCLDVMTQLPERSVQCIFTDPPYGHNNNNNGDLIHRREAVLGRGAIQESRPIANDGAEDASRLVRALFTEACRLLSPGCCCCCCGGGGPDPQFARWSLWMDEHLEFKQMVVWDKGPMGMGWHYRRSYETVLVGMNPGAPCRWNDTTKKIENVIRPGYRGIHKIVPSKNDHPTPKPPELAMYFIGLHTFAGDVVVDPFMGGASTAIACIRTGRKFIGIEIDPTYFDMAVKRIEAELQQPRLPFAEPEPMLTTLSLFAEDAP